MPPNGKPSAIQNLGRLRGVAETVPPTGLVLLSIFSVQLGAAIAKGLFDQLGPAGTVFLRVGFAALVLLLLWRPPLGSHACGGYLVAVLFGLALVAMNFFLYQALDRIPLGVAVTVEFVGPLGVALALLAGCFWAAYILLSARTGSIFPGGTGLVIALCVGTVVLVPVGIAGGGAALLDPKLLLVGFAVAMLSSAAPYSLELEALRKLPARVFGVLMSLEPAVAALVGFIVLGERLEMRALAAVLLVTVAVVGASRFGGLEPRD